MALENRPILYRFRLLNGQQVDFVFCGRKCALLFRAFPSKGEYQWGKPQPGVAVGCFWCGGSIGDDFLPKLIDNAERMSHDD